MESNIIRRSRNSSSKESLPDESQNQENYTIRRSTRQRQLEDMSEESEGESEQQAPTIRYRISIVTSLLLVGIAGMLDITELVVDLVGTLVGGVGVVFGYIKDFFTVIIIPLIFFICGAPFWKGRKAKKKMVTMISTFLISLVPWIGAFMPETTIGVIATIYLTRKEDKENALHKAKKSKITRMRRR